MISREDIQVEKKSEYIITENRKKLWVIELDLLDMLETACKALDINYFLLFGSALGAVRHDGFIPWDDDIDLGMLREDFEKFRNNYQSFFPEYVDIQYGVTENSFDMLMRIRDARSTGIIKGERQMKRNQGAFIEIYVFDKVCDNNIQTIQIMTSKFLCSCLAMINTPNDRTVKGRLRKLMLIIFGRKKLWSLYEKVCRLQEKKASTYVNLISTPKYSAERKRFMIDYESVSRSIVVPFEYTRARIPVGNDKYLIQIYRDYMALPPVEKRGMHHENLVFYDPNNSYLKYEESDIPDKYFAGDSTLELL